MSLSLRNGLLGSPGFGLRGNVVPLRKKVAPMVLYDNNTVAWYDYTDLNTITKDGSNYVSKWADRLGSGRDLLQGAQAQKPLFQADGIYFNGVGGVGTQDFMKAQFMWAKPNFMYLVFSQKTWKASATLFEAYTVDSIVIGQSATTSPNIYYYSGTAFKTNTNLPLNTFAIVRFNNNGASSFLQVNNTTSTTGNAGSSTMDGFAISRGSALNYEYIYAGNLVVKECILRRITDTTDNQTTIMNYLSKKYLIDI